MAYQVKLVATAEMDLEAAITYYEAQKTGLGIEFLLRLYNTVSFLRENPRIYPCVYKTFRRALLKQFPYAVFHVIEEARNEVIILAIWHTSQNPEELKSRLDR